MNNMEELVLQGQQNLTITEQKFSELAQMTDEALKQKVLLEYMI